MRKDDLNVHVFQGRNWCSTKSDRWFFFLALAVRRPFHGEDFKWGEYGGAGLLSGGGGGGGGDGGFTSSKYIFQCLHEEVNII